MMTSFISGKSRSQSTLFPASLDDYIHEDNPVRAIDVFVDTLNFLALGFTRSEPNETGVLRMHQRRCSNFIYMVTSIAFNPVVDWNEKHNAT